MDDSRAQGDVLPLLRVFTGKKVNCVRWRPTESQQHSSQPTQFVCGCYGYECALQLWDCSIESDSPGQIDELAWNGDVTCINYISPQVAVVSSSDGAVSLVRHNSSGFELGAVWSRLHYCKLGALSCTCVAVSGTSVASVGEDGRINLLDISAPKPLRVIDEASCCSINCVTHVGRSQLVTADMRGQLRLFDLRDNDSNSGAVATSSVQQSCMTALCRHPSQQHVLVSGDTDGRVCVWDMRQPRLPTADLALHAQQVSELQFHASNPSHLFSAAQDGSVWHWHNTATTNTAAAAANVSINRSLGVPASSFAAGGGSGGVSWLTVGANKRQLQLTSLVSDTCLPLNCLDVGDSPCLISGGDNASVYIVGVDL